MSRMHSSRKGKASSHRPMVTASPAWVQITGEEVTNQIIQMGKLGKRASQIGLVLRDQYGVPNVKLLTGKSIIQILEEAGIRPQLPEDLSSLIERVKSVSAHIAENKGDNSAKRGLQLIESKIRRLAKYYARNGVIPSNWKYSQENQG
ncbi:MAG: 30S ribosomal protein S15 [Thermoplasmata archaeon]|uniref:Small ribosomal subunit protein uS15 n=1 Tax=Candidatus Sysuiplasma superficiale TaxID=2823368 RepID=A0A8J7YN52_9ARCH|nr:30S ribosomal protein S15 [Candidatus Sysuiplasma superficiale]MBX8643312.1 30S ribosomal protein S15 [Candidatus Sysuiplasma superficiale]MCL4346357.1 30S ribosomal protein S15 [Candidatus Thermoplasmatota archaeon]